MVQQQSSGKAMAFEEQLGNLNCEWKTVIQEIEEKKHSIEKTAKKWWEFTRNKMKMMRWLKKKENDADFRISFDNAQEQMNTYQVIDNMFGKKSGHWECTCFHP